MVSLDEFLKTGRLGAIAFDMTPDEIHEILGEPESVSVQKDPLLWKYGALELAFCKQPDGASSSLASIALHFRDPSQTIPERLNLKGWTPSRDTKFEEFLTRLRDAGLFPEVRNEPNRHALIRSAHWAVRITYEGGRLYAIHCSDRREPKFKQYLVNVRRADLDAIRREAQARSVSITVVLSRWIEERVASLQPQEESVRS
jgi:hypothetical protein